MGTIYIKKTDSINKIKSALMNTGNAVIFEKAIYKITETLYFNSNNIFKFNGATLQMSAPIHNILMSYTTSNTIGYNGIRNVQIYDLKIEQMYSKYGACQCNGLTLWHCNNILISNCSIEDTICFHGLEINGSCNVTIESSQLLGYIADRNANYREFSQIDFSSETAIFVHKSGSKCYDNTVCKSIKYNNCKFGKSKSRPSAPYCIGNHCQPVNKFHENITIKGCRFIGDRTNVTGCSIHLTAMNNVIIEDCYSEGFARFVLINNSTYSYDNLGKKKDAMNTKDGICMNIIVRNNIIKPLNTFKANNVYSHTRTGVNHIGINEYNNLIIK